MTCAELCVERLIPARAGKTSFLIVGELELGGSSPRGRGKRHVDRRRPKLRRLIPARAGKTLMGW